MLGIPQGKLLQRQLQSVCRRKLFPTEVSTTFHSYRLTGSRFYGFSAALVLENGNQRITLLGLGASLSASMDEIIAFAIFTKALTCLSGDWFLLCFSSSATNSPRASIAFSPCRLGMSGISMGILPQRPIPILYKSDPPRAGILLYSICSADRVSTVSVRAQPKQEKLG